MINSLYPPFKKWSETGSVWLYSDPHFGDADTYYLRGLLQDLADTETIKSLDEKQITNINKKVSNSDTIIFLGDIGDIESAKCIRGYKVLIMGNHDKGATYYKDVFNEIYTGCLLISEKILLSHEPVLDLPPYWFNIHGHDHSGTDFMNFVLKSYDADMPKYEMQPNYLKTIKQYELQHLNICAEWINYAPVPLKLIIESGVLSNIPTIHKNYLNNLKEKKGLD